MGFNFSSSSDSSSSGLNSNSKISWSSDKDIKVKKIGSESDLEKIIKNAKNSGIKSLTIKDNRSSPIRVGLSDLFGNRVDVSLLPGTERIYEIQFI